MYQKVKSRFVVFLCIGIMIISAAYQLIDQEKNRLPKNKIELGKLLFFDPLLSKDHTISCASCHKPEFAFADTSALSLGINHTKTTRNTPSSMNVKDHRSFFWDGRANTLEQQAIVPLTNPNEMGLPLSEALERLNSNEFYLKSFKKIFKTPATEKALTESLAEFQRSLVTTNSAFDRYLEGDKNAISESAKRGRVIFIEKGSCFECHFGTDFTGDEFTNIGLYNGHELNDEGRFGITKDSAFLGNFKTPGLRNVSVTAPYMHNGMFKTLREVIDYYDEPNKFVVGSRNRLIRQPLGLTEQEKNDLEEFMKSLTDDRFLKKNN